MVTLTRILAPGEAPPPHARPAAGVTTQVVEDSTGTIVEIWRYGEKVFSIGVTDSDPPTESVH